MNKPDVENKIKSFVFRKEREHTWSEMERLLDKIKKKGIASCTFDELIRLPQLYRATISSLSVAKNISLDKALVTYLEDLSKRAFIQVYRFNNKPKALVKKFIFNDLPRAVKKSKFYWLFSIAIFLSGFLTGLLVGFYNPDIWKEFSGSAYAEYINPVFVDILENIDNSSIEELSINASFFIFTTVICLGCFVMGFFLGIPILIIMFVQGASLGLLMFEFDQDFLSKILIHCCTQFPLFLSSAAGFIIAECFYKRTDQPILKQLQKRAIEAGTVLVGAMIILALIFFVNEVLRFFESSQDYLSVLVLIFFVLIFYFLFFGRKPTKVLNTIKSNFQ